MIRFLVFLLSIVFVSHCSAGAAKIYDCFLFFNELELLEVRLEELYDHVDYFVLVEAVETHQGGEKTLYFEENKERYQKYADKILHIVVQDRVNLPPLVREAFQRQFTLAGLNNCKNEDIILISDLDEILRPSSIPTIRLLLEADPQGMILCRHQCFFYYLNRYSDPFWPGVLALTFGELKKEPFIQQVKDRTRDGATYQIENAGWHFTYQGGLSRVLEKLEAFSAPWVNTPQNRSYDEFLRKVSRLKKVEIDETFPIHIQNNLDYWIDRGFIDHSDSTFDDIIEEIQIFSSPPPRPYSEK